MRTQILKLITGNSTKAERRFMELCKSLHIPFRTKVVLKGHEIDFIIGRYAIEIDGHPHKALKNNLFWSEGYFPIHLYNWEINENLVQWLKQIKCQLNQD